MNDLDFAALLCSRLCHDLISPVGAISNGIEILSDESDENMRAEVMKLLELSASQTSNRLKFYRLAFGAAGGIGSIIPMRDVSEAAESLFVKSPINLRWNSQIGQLDKNCVKLILNMVLVASESLIRGGDIQVNITNNDDHINLEVSVVGDRIIFQDKSKDVICGNDALIEPDPKVAPAYLAASMAKLMESKIEYTANKENNFTLSALI